MGKRSGPGMAAVAGVMMNSSPAKGGRMLHKRKVGLLCLAVVLVLCVVACDPEKEAREAAAIEEAYATGPAFFRDPVTREARKWLVFTWGRDDQPWDPDFWIAKFGEWEELTVDSYNPKIIKAYYFEALNVTLMVNVLEGTMVTWREGRRDGGP